MSELTPEEISAARRAAATAQHERSERATKRLFMTDGECHLRAQAHAEASRAGIVNHRAVKAHADAVVAAMKPVLEETSLTGPEVLELRREMSREPMTAAEGEKRFDTFLEDMRQPIYGTRKIVEAKVQAAKTAAHASPALRKALNTGNAANSVTLGRALYQRVHQTHENPRSVAKPSPILRKPTVIIK
jgi:hypothetical protein